ncbi:hypothetical protein TrispH2_009217 [Trichoplax sp. H2]|nr:hypothetical protein TrispH2_009217 [Trichoplax sp. H2]|eukprot:RDD40149.1 hypothetical protein TrispH2_009217 [Trichoplax sp. H2]
MSIRAVVQRTVTYAVHQSPRAIVLDSWASASHLPWHLRRLARPPFLSEACFFNPLINHLEKLREVKTTDRKSHGKEESGHKSQCKTKDESSHASAEQNQPSHDENQAQAKNLSGKTTTKQSENSSSQNNRDDNDVYYKTSIARCKPFSPWFGSMPAWPLRFVEEALDELSPQSMFQHHLKLRNAMYNRAFPQESEGKMQEDNSSSKQANQNIDKARYTYHKSTITKSNGEKKVTVTRSIGDRKHTLTTLIDADGNQQTTEDYINVHENQVEQFETDLKAYSQYEGKESIMDNNVGINENPTESTASASAEPSLTKDQ